MKMSKSSLLVATVVPWICDSYHINYYVSTVETLNVVKKVEHLEKPRVREQLQN